MTIFINNIAAGSNGGSTTTSMVATLSSVLPGSLVAVKIKYQSAATTATLSDGLGSVAAAATRTDHSNNDIHTQWLYILSSVGSVSPVAHTVTLGGARDYWHIQAWQFAPATGTFAFNTEPANGGSFGNSTTLSSGNFSPSGSDLVVLGGNGDYGGSSLTSPLINGAAADGSLISNIGGVACASWYRILTSGFTNGTAAATQNSGEWTCSAISFVVGGGGGGGRTLFYRSGLDGHSASGPKQFNPSLS